MLHMCFYFCWISVIDKLRATMTDIENSINDFKNTQHQRYETCFCLDVLSSFVLWNALSAVVLRSSWKRRGPSGRRSAPLRRRSTLGRCLWKQTAVILLAQTGPASARRATGGTFQRKWRRSRRSSSRREADTAAGTNLTTRASWRCGQNTAESPCTDKRHGFIYLARPRRT